MAEKKSNEKRTDNAALRDTDSREQYEVYDVAGRPVRTYKDRIFRMIFKEKEEFLELYNALNGTEYDDPENMTVTTLENAIYFGMKNDVSYLLHDQLSLYEHQSSKNPNMPLRNLFYVSNVYSELTKNENLHHSALVQIPEPVFIVFYNGTAPMPERSIARLSDAYIQKSEHPALEIETVILNINPGYNEELKKRCKTLQEYMIFVSRVREFQQIMSFEQAINVAVNECIEQGILREFLQKNKAEVITVSIFEYNAELHMKQIEDAAERYGYQTGLQKGHLEGRREGEVIALLKLIQKKHRNKMQPEEVSDIIETDVNKVKKIYKYLSEFPEADEESLYKIWLETEIHTEE